MAFQGGVIPLIGVPVRGVTDTVFTVGTEAALGNTTGFAGRAGRQLAQPTLNVALSTVLGNKISESVGLDVAGGQQLLASQVSEFLGSETSAALSDQLSRSLGAVGSNPAVQSLASTAANGAAGSLVNLFTGGGTTEAQALFGAAGLDPVAGGPIAALGLGASSHAAPGPSKTYPGAGSEPEADYGGRAYTLGNTGGDVVFSITPAQSGPAATGDPLSASATATTVPFTSLSSDAASSLFSENYNLQNTLKLSSMVSNTNGALNIADASETFWKPTTLQGFDQKVAVLGGTSEAFKLDTANAFRAATVNPAGALLKPTVGQFEYSGLKAASSGEIAPGLTGSVVTSPWEPSPKADLFSSPEYSLKDAPVSSLGDNPLAGSADTGATGTGPSGWTFITAPENVEWNTNAQADRVPIFGTNKPPVVVGTKGMRDLTLGNALVEGFMRNKTVEQKIQALETLFSYTQGKGFVNVPVFHVTANSKKYGGSDGGYFIINEMRVKETMRDLRGDATRAYVDVSFIQVPEYQVGTGRDQSTLTSNASVGALEQSNKVAQQAQQSGQPSSGPNSAAPKTTGTGSPTTGGGGSAGGNKPPAPPKDPSIDVIR